MVNELSPPEPVQPNTEIKPAYHLDSDQIIDFDQDPPVYRTQNGPNGGILCWDASVLSEAEDEKMLGDPSISIGSLVRGTVASRTDYLLEGRQCSQKERQTLSEQLNKNTVGEVFALLIEAAQERHDMQRVIALKHALHNGHRLPSRKIQRKIQQICKEGSSPREAFQLLTMKEIDARDFKPLKTSFYQPVTLKEYEALREEHKKASQPSAKKIIVAVHIENLPGKTAEDRMQAGVNIIDDLTGQGVIIQKEAIGDQNVTYQVRLNSKDLQQRDLNKITQIIVDLKSFLSKLAFQNPNLTVSEAIQKLVNEKQQKVDQASLSHIEFDPDVESPAQDSRILEFLSRNLNIVPGLAETRLSDLATLKRSQHGLQTAQKDGLSMFFKAMEIREVIETRPESVEQIKPPVLSHSSGAPERKSVLKPDNTPATNSLRGEKDTSEIAGAARRVASTFYSIDYKDFQTVIGFRRAVRELLEMAGSDFTKLAGELPNQNRRQLLEIARRVLASKGIDLQKLLDEIKKTDS